MTFSSVVFLFIFLPVIFFLYFILANDLIRNILLVAASLIFYAFGEPVAVFIMIISIILNYVFGRICAGEKHDKLAVFAAVLLNIGLLFVFKYLGFVTETINAVTPLNLPVPVIKLPIGISFFTFQGLSYVIDVYRDKKMVQKNLLSVFLYISFFPQLIAGPIVKYHDIEKQLHKREFSADRVSRGINRFIIGLAKKVIISNQMGYVADLVFNSSVSGLSTLSAWLGAVCYMFQIFYDFSGYSDMAIGLGCIFGFDFKENFNYPYISWSVQDFWRRWHISLSTWFKEYVYIPLGGNRKGKFRTNINRTIVFFLTGLWHGANFTFIVWGLLHGMFLILEEMGIIPTKKKWFRPFGHIYTLMVALLTFVIFRADSLSQAGKIMVKMFSGASGDMAVNSTILAGVSVMTIVALIFAVIFATPVAKLISEKMEVTKLKGAAEHLQYAGTLVLFAFCILLLISSEYNPFIYFRF